MCNSVASKTAVSEHSAFDSTVCSKLNLILIMQFTNIDLCNLMKPFKAFKMMWPLMCIFTKCSFYNMSK